MIMKIALVALGGGLGSLCRYLASLGAAKLFGGNFPWGTMAVNLSGCLMIGCAFALAERNLVMGPSARLFFMTGFLGGLTTFSSYALESVNAASSGQTVAALANVAVNNVAGLGLALLGMAAVRHWT